MIELLWSTVSMVLVVLATMAVVSGVEAAIPLRARGPWNTQHVTPNLAITLITLALPCSAGKISLLYLVPSHGRRKGI